jgi:hypothetical protein
LELRFPLKLFFHNDDPEPRSWSTATAQTYAEAYGRYKGLRPEYLRENADTSAIGRFFREEVDAGYNALNELSTALWSVLEEGRSVTLDVRGHASPLARNAYNRKLSSRRIESLRNHLRETDRGRLAPYLEGRSLNGARLAIRELPFGEDRSAAGVSDDLADVKRSVFSVEASRERRIEVEALQLLAPQGPRALERQLLQLGDLRPDEERIVRFSVGNAQQRPMRLLRADAECGCTAAKLPDAPIAPGERGEVEVRFNGRAAAGPLRRTVLVITDGVPERIELVIEGTMLP